MLTFNTYSDLMQYMDENDDKVVDILNYDDFGVIMIGDQYWYYEKGINDCDEFYEVTIISKLIYNIFCDLLVGECDILHSLFNCDCCGEYVNGDNIQYLWFKRI